MFFSWLINSILNIFLKSYFHLSPAKPYPILIKPKKESYSRFLFHRQPISSPVSPGLLSPLFHLADNNVIIIVLLYRSQKIVHPFPGFFA